MLIDRLKQSVYSILGHPVEYPIDFTENPHIRPVCLPDDDQKDYSRFSAKVAGRGTISDGGDLSSYLQYVDVAVVSMMCL